MVMGPGKDPNDVFGVLRTLTRLGMGGKMASGRQYVSWMHTRDFCRAVQWMKENDSLSGVVNVCSPHPLPDRDMMAILRRQFHVPFGLPAPAPLLEIGAFFLRTETELILKSRRVIPGKLPDSGFRFEFPGFEAAVRENLRIRSSPLRPETD